MPGRCAVLIVDVDRSRLERLERYARAAGLAVSTAGGYAAARQELRTSPPDVVVSALCLSAYNGLHLAIVAGQDREQSAALIYSEEVCAGNQSDAAAVDARMAAADEVLQPHFWRALARTRDLDTALSSATLRAIA